MKMQGTAADGAVFDVLLRGPAARVDVRFERLTAVGTREFGHGAKGCYRAAGGGPDDERRGGG